MSKKAFGGHYYSMENSYATKIEAVRAGAKLAKTGKYFVRVSGTGFGKGGHPWAVYLRSK
jgi:hypothetical protein